jgi:hypothetical protein
MPRSRIERACRIAQQGRSASSEVRDSGTTICVIRRIGGRKSHPGFHRLCGLLSIAATLGALDL